MKSEIFLVILTAILVLASSAELPAQQTAGKETALLPALSASFEQIAERVSPAVVQIFTTGYGVGTGSPNVMTKQQGIGSGIIIDPDGYILTNAHVVSGAQRIQILLVSQDTGAVAPGELPKPFASKRTAQVVGIDTTTDLALLKIEAKNLTTLPFGNSDSLRQGQLVFAFGSPLGLGNTVTMGVISAVSRQLSPDSPLEYVQTDAPINPGNSGGPLVDAMGRVVGVNTMIISQSGGNEGVGLAIPSNTAISIGNQLRRQGRVQRGVIGVQVQTVNPIMETALGLPQNWGVIVADVAPGGPAEKAGLQIGDVILRVDGKPVENVRQFGTNLYRHAIDAMVTLEIIRDTHKITLRVPVIERPDDPSRFLEMVNPENNLVPQLDILGIDYSPDLAAAMPEQRIPGGILVASMTADAAPPGDRFQPGDVIHAVNRTPVQSLAELRAALTSLKESNPVVIQIERHGMLSFVAFELD